MNAEQHRRAPEVYQLSDGTWSHSHSAYGGFTNKAEAETDLRFCKEWERRS